MKKNFLLAIAISGLLSACSTSNKADEPVEPQTKIPINVSMGVWSRATDAGYESGDKVGIYVVNYSGATAGVLASSGNYVDNMRFTYSTKWTPDSEIYWADKTTKADIYCYYPYGTPTNVAAYDFTVNANQSTIAAYKASDFLWGKASNLAPTADVIPITTNHTMSNILVYVQPGTGFTAETLAAATKTVKVCNVKNTSTIDLKTGVATATGATTQITLYNEGAYYRALVVPQTVADGTNLVSVTIDGVEYTYAKGCTFAANTQHKFTLTVNKASSGVNIGVGGWDTDEIDHGGSAE